MNLGLDTINTLLLLGNSAIAKERAKPLPKDSV